MANNIHELAKEAFDNGNYQLALELFERIIQFSDKLGTSPDSPHSIDAYIGYGDSLARCGRIRESFEVYTFVCNQLGYIVPVERLQHLAVGLMEIVTSLNVKHVRQWQQLGSLQSMTMQQTSTISASGNGNSKTASERNESILLSANVDTERNYRRDRRRSSCSESNCSCCSGSECAVLLDNKCKNVNADIDPLMCAMCKGVIVWPVTMACGHTFCRNCIFNQTQCQVCDKKFLMYGDGFKQDVLVSRLLEKWWSPIIQAQIINSETQALLRRNALDEALKSCNASLEKCPTNYNGLLLRSEVLYRLNHFQSSLADADNAIKCQPNSHEAHLKRAMALAALGKIDDAIVAHCLSTHFNKTLSSYSSAHRMELAKLLQIVICPQKIRKSASVLPYDEYLVKDYADQTHFACIRHFSAVRRNACLKSALFDCKNGFCTDRDEENMHTSQLDCCQLERSHKFSPYKKQQKFIRNLKKIHRKQCDIEANKIFDLDHLASAVTNAVSNRSIVSNVNIRVADLLDKVEFELSKARKMKKSRLLDVNASLIDLSDFDCVLCYRTLWKPVVTPCGHTYCMVCLDRCLDYSSSCPLCKTSLVDNLPTVCSGNQLRNGSVSPRTTCNLMSFASSKKSVTRFIEIAMQRFIPMAYKRRQLLEIEKEPSVAVFICTTAYPNVPCPLYVYEPRHRLMIRRAIESGHRQFGIVQPQANGGYSDFGTILDIRDCVLLGNGCSILSTMGSKRFKVIARNEKDGYETAKVEYIYDEAITLDRLNLVKSLNESIYKKAIDWYNSLPPHIHDEIHKSFGSMPKLQRNIESISDGPSWAWYIIALLPLNQNLKVEILATTDLEKRLRAIDKTLEYVAAQQRRSVCVVSCEGVQQCHAIDCCLRATSSNQLDDEAQSHAAQSQVTNILL